MFKSNEELYRTLCDDKQAIVYLQNHNLINCPICIKCKNPLSIGKYYNKFRYYCYSDNIKKGIYSETLFEKTNLRSIQIIELLRQWIIDPSPRKVSLQTGVDEKTVTRLFAKLRIAIKMWIIDNQNIWKNKIGGENEIVEIDECCLGKTKISVAKHKRYNKHMWILGGYQRNSKLFFLIPVKDRKIETLMPIINDYVYKGTTIITDELKTYNVLKNFGYTHKAVNHSKYFVQPDDKSIHINTIEGFWMHLRKYMPNIKKDSELYTLYFLELALRKRYQNNLFEILKTIINHYNLIKKKIPN